MFRVDLHAHTRFFHAWPGRPTPFDPVGARLLAWGARRRGIDAVATTNHDYFEPFDVGGVTLLPGIEISTTRGHVTVVGPDPPEQTDPDELTPQEAVELAHDRDCAAILAHPFRDSSVRGTDAQVDAVEANGKHPSTHPRVRDIADERDLPIVGGSDAHYPFEVGRGYTRIDAEELTPEAVVEAIRDGRVEPGVDRGRSDQVLESLYQVVHRVKGHR